MQVSYAPSSAAVAVCSVHCGALLGLSSAGKRAASSTRYLGVERV